MTWEKSYANADKTKTYCVYDGPSEAAVREAAKLSGMPVDNVTEIPVDIKAEPRGAVQHIAAGNHRYLVKRSGAPGAMSNSDRKYGVTLITSYATADKKRFVLGVRSAELLGRGERGQGQWRAVRVDRGDSRDPLPGVMGTFLIC